MQQNKRLCMVLSCLTIKHLNVVDHHLSVMDCCYGGTPFSWKRPLFPRLLSLGFPYPPPSPLAGVFPTDALFDPPPPGGGGPGHVEFLPPPLAVAGPLPP